MLWSKHSMSSTTPQDFSRTPTKQKFRKRSRLGSGGRKVLDENNLITYEVGPEFFSVLAARKTMYQMSRAIDRGELKLHTALHPTSDQTNVSILFLNEGNWFQAIYEEICG
jgi:hypothetical protein